MDHRRFETTFLSGSIRRNLDAWNWNPLGQLITPTIYGLTVEEKYQDHGQRLQLTH